MKKGLIRGDKGLFHVIGGRQVDGANEFMSGNCSGIWGDCSELWGNCSWLRGDCSWLRGDLDGLEITEEDRIKGIKIEDLVNAS